MPSNKDQASASEPVSESSGRGGWVVRIQEWLGCHPRLAILVAAALAVTLNSYPVIFCGKSYVSPASCSYLISDQFPFAPGMERSMYHWQHYSDTFAAMWWAVPVSFVESRSLLDYGEIPLWNRYGHAGDILLGQGVSMLGDPLQFIVIAGRGSAGAWDVKFLLAKLVFCVGIGWLVLRRLDNRGLAVIYAALGAYCGAYIFINNHPVFFVLAYAPWILLSAVEFLAGQPGKWLKWGLLWLAANVFCFNAGHLETSVVLIGGLNFAALVFALVFLRDWPGRARMLVRLGGGILLFLGLTAPAWISFATALPQAYTVHSQITVAQLSPMSFMGMFDDYFYHCYFPDYVRRAAPGTSLLIMAGCILSLRRQRYLQGDVFFWVNTGAILFWAACVFGLVPASLVAAVPFLNRVGHVQVDFSYLLVIHLTLQSAYGFNSLLKLDGFRQAAGDFEAVVSIMVPAVGIYYFVSFLTPYYFGYLVPSIVGAIGAPALFKYLWSRNGRIGVLGWTGIVALGFIPNSRFGLYTFGNDALATLPGPRLVLNPPLETLEEFGQGGDPFRIAGLGWNMAGDYAAVYGLEDIRSCAPLSNPRFIELVGHFPGFYLPHESWELMLQNPGDARPLLNVLNVKYVLADHGTNPPGRDRFTVRNTPEFTVLENKQVWPRAFFASQIVPVSGNADFTRYLVAHADRPFVAVDQAEVDRRAELRRLAKEIPPVIMPAEHYQLLPNATAFDVQATGPGVVCLTEGQAAGFLAYANGKSVPVLTVNRAFKGVYLPEPGNYHLEFRYRPPYWNFSLSLFWLSAGIVSILGALEYKRARRQNPRMVPPAAKSAET